MDFLGWLKLTHGSMCRLTLCALLIGWGVSFPSLIVAAAQPEPSEEAQEIFRELHRPEQALGWDLTHAGAAQLRALPEGDL